MTCTIQQLQSICEDNIITENTVLHNTAYRICQTKCHFSTVRQVFLVSSQNFTVPAVNVAVADIT